MTSSRPYLIRALYEWISDNGMTPHVLVDAGVEGVEVPPGAVKEGKVTLNIGMTAVRGLEIGNDLIEFSARFSGTSHQVRVPPAAILAIYSRENGQGMMFPPDEQPPEGPDEGDDGEDGEKKLKGAHLRVVK